MMEENRKGPSIFYAVVGVATLVVAIIGATFAFFSASATVEGGDDVIQGGTNDQLSTALTAKVERVVFEGANATSGDSLVPSDITATADSVNAAVAAKCVDDGYTGCHLYKIEAQSSQDVKAADLRLETLTLTGVTNKDDWKYIIYSNDGTSNNATGTVIGSPEKAFEVVSTAPVSFHSTGLTANQPVYYYLLIYIANQDKPQNAADASNVTGTYAGTVTFAAAGGGKVSATFSATTNVTP